jgi:two-component system, cell cycle response regulator DivK
VGQKILVVEDNELNLKLFCDLLRAHQYETEPVRDGREALDRARAFAPDLIVMDIQMPHVSGLELIERIKADSELKATPVMAVTAYAAKGDEERIRDAGAEGYVSKPISVAKFVEAVAKLLTTAEGAAASAEADAVKASKRSVEVEKEVEAKGPRAAAKAVEASAGAEAAVADVTGQAPQTQEAAEPEGEAAPETFGDEGTSERSEDQAP